MHRFPAKILRSTHLVLAASPDVLAERQLLAVKEESPLEEEELLGGAVDDIRGREGDAQLHQLLVLPL